MPGVREENYLLNRRFIRACEIIMTDETIPEEEIKSEPHVTTKNIPTFGYKLMSYLIPLKGNEDILTVDTQGYSLNKIHEAPYSKEWLYMFDNDMVGNPWIRGVRIPTNYVSYFDIKTPRRNSAIRKYLEGSVGIVEDYILERFSDKQITELTDEELLGELHMLIGNLIGVEDSFASNYQDFAMYYQGCHSGGNAIFDAEAHMYLLHCESLGYMEILSRKKDILIITGMHDDGNFKTTNKLDDNNMRDKVCRYILTMRDIKKTADMDKHQAIEKRLEMI